MVVGERLLLPQHLAPNWPRHALELSANFWIGSSIRRHAALAPAHATLAITGIIFCTAERTVKVSYWGGQSLTVPHEIHIKQLERGARGAIRVFQAHDVQMSRLQQLWIFCVLRISGAALTLLRAIPNRNLLARRSARCATSVALQIHTGIRY